MSKRSIVSKTMEPGNYEVGERCLHIEESIALLYIN